MPSSKPSSLPLRYLKARLRILKRPMVWGSTTVVLATMMVFAEYWRQSAWMNPEMGDRPTVGSTATVPSLDSTNTDNSISLSQEDSAIGADIDTLPLLLREFNIPEDAIQVEPINPTLVTPSPPDTQPTASTLEIPAILDPNARLETTPSGNPFSPSSFNSEFMGTQNESNLELNLSLLTNSVQAEQPFRPTATTPSTNAQPSSLSRSIPLAPGSPLQTAIQTRSSPNPSMSGLQPYSSQIYPGLVPSTVSSPGSVVPVSPYQPYQPSVSTEPSAAPFQTSPPPGSTGYTLPPTLRIPVSTTPATPVPANQTYIDSFSSQSPYTPLYNPAFPQPVPSNPAQP